MCGIAGIYNFDNKPIDKNDLLNMTRIIRHRGPDDEGYLLVDVKNKSVIPCHHDDTIDSIKKATKPLNNNFNAHIGFGFRRLSILDLSENGHQPMCSHDGRFWIIFNGEVYNYIELREQLSQSGYTFSTGTDTEVILYAYQEWGKECLNRFNGMWSFALWDNRDQVLFCARDRFGIKPFYYSLNSNSFIFGSEVKQILINTNDRTLNEEMIYRSLKLGSFLVYKDETYFKNIKSLPHSHYLIIKNGKTTIEKYYDLDAQQFERSTLSLGEATDEYARLFKDSVKLRMRSDVKVGSTLSGGLDSSGIVCEAAKYVPDSFNTFSAYYDYGPVYDERKWINIVNEHIEGRGHSVSPKADSVVEDIDKITFINDFPFIGPSFVSQYYVMKEARKNSVTVLLDGQGSDEMTGGYNHAFYRYYADQISGFQWFEFAKQYGAYLRYNKKGSLPARIAKTGLTLLFNESFLYQQEAKRNHINPLSRQFDESHIFTHADKLKTSRLSNFLYNLLMSGELQTLLHFEDRNAMAHSIESRVPFLDYRLVEFAFSLPSSFKIYKNYGKYIHREALKQIAPVEIVNRKDKVNFRSPADAIWLNNELKPFVEGILNSPDFLNRDIFNHKVIKTLFKDYLNGNKKNSTIIWRVIMLEKWFNVFVDNEIVLQ